LPSLFNSENEIHLIFIQKFNFLTTFVFYRDVLFMQQQGSDKLNRTMYLAPFKWQLWGAVLAAMLLLTLALWLCCGVGHRCVKTEPRLYSFSESLFSVFGSFCSQGNYIGEDGGMAVSG
jgi:hypothetical protein